MSDYNSSLPIRSEADGTDERLHSKLVDFADPSGVDKQAEISEKLVHIRNFGQDPADLKVQMRLSEDGAPNGDGVYDAADNTNPANVGLVALSRNASPADSQQTLRLTAITNAATTVRALDVGIRDENGEPFTEANPLPVSWIDSEGTEINNYNTAAAVAAAGTSNHDYTTLAAFKFSQFNAAASGKMKIEVRVETSAGSGTFNTVFVKFNSTANPNIDVVLREPIAVASGVIIRIIRTNLDNQAQDLYSTISGHQVT